MSKFSRKVKWLLLAVLISSALNILAFYIIQNSIGLAEEIKNAADEQSVKSLRQKEMFSDVFSSFIFTLDIFGLLYLLYRFIKMVFRSLKNSTSTKK